MSWEVGAQEGVEGASHMVVKPCDCPMEDKTEDKTMGEEGAWAVSSLWWTHNLSGRRGVGRVPGLGLEGLEAGVFPGVGGGGVLGGQG